MVTIVFYIIYFENNNMKELFLKFPSIDHLNAKDMLLIDTCFFISVFDHHENIKKFSKIGRKAMTSFNVLELIHVDHKLNHKHDIRKFLENLDPSELVIVDVPVHPGEWQKEKEFVESVDPLILKHCQDNSDAVLLAVAIKTHSDILTKDKHHIFNAYVENYVERDGIKVHKELKDVL